jgi:hypothetical protein
MGQPRVPSPRETRSTGFLADVRGAAAAEIALWLTVLTVPALSVLDVGMYAFKTMEVQAAAQQAIEAGRRVCGWNAVPMTSSSNCTQSTFTSALTTGAQNTSLGSKVSVASGYPKEGYYCSTSGGTLTLVGTAGTSGSPPTPPSPNTCTSVISGSATAAGDYVQVKVTYAYAPTFNGISLSAALPTPITATAWLRLQ